MQQMNSFRHQAGHTPAQVAEIFGVKTSTVHAWISRKEMRATKVGHRRYISLQQMREFREMRQTGEYINYTYAPGHFG